MLLSLLVVFSVLGTLDSCIKNNYERLCCDSGECPNVDCACEDPQPFFCVYGCNRFWGYRCKSCYVPPPSPPRIRLSSMPVLCHTGGLYCTFDFCCPAAKCTTLARCAASTTVATTSTAAQTTTAPATTTSVATTTTSATTSVTTTTPATTTPTTTTTSTTTTTTVPTTTTVTTTTTTTTTTPVPKCAYNQYLTVRLVGGSRGTDCLEAPGYVSIKIAFDETSDPLPFCGGVLVAENQIQTSDFCASQLGLLPTGGIVTVGVYDFDDNKISDITDFTSTNALVTFDPPVTFSAADCLLPACFINDTSVLDLTACKIYGSGATDAATLESDATHVIPVSIIGSCPDSTNWCIDPASTVQTCVGDAGGPLICPDDMGQFLVAGLTFQEPTADPCFGPPEFLGLRPLP